MSTIAIFIVLIGIGLLLMQPVLALYTQNYTMRVRYNHNVQAASVNPKSITLVSLCKGAGQSVLKIFPFLRETAVKKTLIEANYRSPDHIEILTGAKVIVSTLAFIFPATDKSNSTSPMILACVMSLCAWTLPNFVLMGRAKKRKQKLFIELPTLLDLVAVCSKAGLGLMACLDRVAKHIEATCPIMKEELEQLLTDIKIFRHPLSAALKEMSQRCGVEELDSLTSALVVADQKGADISTTLQKQSAALREKIKRKAEEQLSTAPVKMVPVIILFILPLMLIPTIGPPVMQLITALKMMSGS